MALALLCLLKPGDGIAAPASAAQPPLDEIQRSMRDIVRRRGFWCAGNVAIARPAQANDTQPVRVTCSDGHERAAYDVRIDASHLDVREVWEDR